MKTTHTIICLLLLASPAGRAVETPLAPEEVTAFRAAIRDLAATYGPAYPGAPQYLQRLAALESEATSGVDTQRLRQAWSELRQEALLANPLVSGQPILYVSRPQYKPDHHNTATFFPNARGEYNSGSFTAGGALKVLHLGATRRVATILDVPQGMVRDPEVNFDGRRMVFALRRTPADSYHIYTAQCDGSALKQLTTAADVDDFDPFFLPDDHIAFTSTREPKYCMCNRHIMANLYRMEPDGANIHQIGKSTLFEGHGSVMDDGRILYDRWEYVDRNFGDGQALWTVNPDGTAHTVFWGNNTASPGAVIDARMIPGTQRAVCVFGSCHDRPWGALAIVDRRLGLDGGNPVIHIWPASARSLIGVGDFDTFTRVRLRYEDPYPLYDPARPQTAGKYFLCSRMTGQGEQMGMYLLDTFGNEILVHNDERGCFDPLPLVARPRPPVIPARRNYEEPAGTFYVQDVYEGTHMAGVARGSVKFLRVVESPEKRFWTDPAWGGQGQEAPAMNWHDFNNKRILGTVPVEADGSAYFTVPAERFVYFQLLDENGMMVQSMRSGAQVQPGERQGCVGCHEDRRRAPTPAATAMPLALKRAPTSLDGWYGPVRFFNYAKEVQPVFDRHCVSCHDYGKPDGAKPVLSGDRDLVFNASYIDLWQKKYIRAVGAGPAQNLPAFGWGSHRSPLAATLRREHHGVKLSPEDFARVVTWIDINAPYYPSYASAFPGHLAGRAPLTGAELEQLKKWTGVPLANLASHDQNRGPQISFDRPELSSCLSGLKEKNPDAYAGALAIIRAGRERLAANPEADRDEFQPCEMDRWRDAKYVARQEIEQRNRLAIRTGEKIYDQGMEMGPIR